MENVSLSLDHETRFDRNVEPLEWFPDRATQPSAEVTGLGCGSATGFGADQHHTALKLQSSLGSYTCAGLHPGMKIGNDL